MSIAADPADAAREQFMLAALEQARRSMAAGGAPVGACLVRDDVVIADAHNEVISRLDITAHAEVMALRAAGSALRTLDLSGTCLYVTVEPCLMCFAACAYAGVSTICYGAPIAIMQRYTGNELCAHGSFSQPGSPELVGGMLTAECTALVEQWGKSLPGQRLP